MSWDTAKKAIDFYGKRTRDTSYANLSFYGGEPLLEFDLIKMCIEYAQKKFEGKLLTLNLTTNGSLLTPEILRYLIKNDVTVLFSIDGPKEIHDKSRKMPDGEGTFDLIYKNIQNLYDVCPVEFNKIIFNNVVDPINDCRCINDFFSCDMFSHHNVMTPVVVPVTGEENEYSNKYINDYKIDTLLALLSETGFIAPDDLPLLAKNYLSNISSYIFRFKGFTKLYDKTSHGGPCKPGVMRLFIDCDGNMFPCEKASETSDFFNIGNIQKGFNTKRIKRIYNIVKLTPNECKKCWAVQLCYLCAVLCEANGKVTKKTILSKCENVIDNNDYMIKNMLAIKEVKEMIKKDTILE